MSDTFTILAIFAHPEDEIGVGSTLAYYSAAGVRTVLACASRGEAATIYCDECATRENLAEVRTHELECACQQLGITELRWLDWPDGGIQNLPRAAAVAQVVALIRDVRPDVIITHPENGLYPHPDHLAVWEITRAAFDAAAALPEDGEETPGLSEKAGVSAAWAAARLFTRALPQSFFDAAPEFAQYRVQLNGQQLPFIGTPDAEIDVIMRVAAGTPKRQAAWDCHRSQHNPDSAFARMPDGLRIEMAENEHFVLAAARVPLPDPAPDRVGSDLLTGLAGADAGPEEPAADPAALAALRTALSAQRVYLKVCEEYARHSSKPPFAALARDLAQTHQEAIYLLAGALRRAGQVTGEVEADARTAAEGLRQPDLPARIRFLSTGAEWAIAAYQAQAAVDTGRRAVWEELVTLTGAQLEAIRAFTGGTETL